MTIEIGTNLAIAIIGVGAFTLLGLIAWRYK